METIDLFLLGGSYRAIEGGVQVHVTATVEVRDQPKPAMVADCLLRFYA